MKGDGSQGNTIIVLKAYGGKVHKQDPKTEFREEVRPRRLSMRKENENFTCPTNRRGKGRLFLHPAHEKVTQKQQRGARKADALGNTSDFRQRTGVVGKVKTMLRRMKRGIWRSALGRKEINARTRNNGRHQEFMEHAYS